MSETSISSRIGRFSRFLHQKFTSSERFGQLEFSIFIFFLGFLILLFITVFLIKKYVRESRKARKRRSLSPRYTELKTRTISSDLSDSSQRSSAVPNDVLTGENLRMELYARLLKNEIKYENFKQRFEIDPRNLFIDESHKLGKGNFGEVKKGELTCKGRKLDVAVKRSKFPKDPVEQELFIAELTVMCAIPNHPNILALVGGITDHPYQIVTEYVEGGSLLEILKASKDNFQDLLIWTESNFEEERQKTEKFKKEDPNKNLESFSTFDLIAIAYQISNGMIHLASIPCVHRDLALRNVLIAKDKTIRIGDLGLGRKYKDKNYYRPMDVSKASIPMFWTAPEAFAEGIFTEQSDMWSFGLCLYELFTLGDEPKVNGSALWQAGGVLQEPKYCPKRVYNLMKQCWNADPHKRPYFAGCSGDLGRYLHNCSKQVYNDVIEKLEAVSQRHEELGMWINNT